MRKPYWRKSCLLGYNSVHPTQGQAIYVAFILNGIGYVTFQTIALMEAVRTSMFTCQKRFTKTAMIIMNKLKRQRFA
jgi:hypothetical protein